MSLTLTFPDENYTLVVNTLPNEGETIDLHRGLTLTRRNGIVYIEGVLVPSVQTTVSLLETQ
jgi:hypothetical protein